MGARFRLDEIGKRLGAAAEAQVAAMYAGKASSDYLGSMIEPPEGSPETKIQQALVRWWDKVEAPRRGLPAHLLIGIPQQAKRTDAGYCRMTAEGMRPGTPDLFLAVPRGPFGGLWIEMKKGDGKLSPPQKVMLADLAAGGYRVMDCYTAGSARETILNYLGPLA